MTRVISGMGVTLALAASAGLLGGCPTRPNPAAANLTCDPETHICVGQLAITSPGPVTYTNAMVKIEVTATPADNPPAEVQILNGSQTLKTVGPPFSYMWDTTTVAEGTYMIGAAAQVGGQTIMAEPIEIVVDRKPPSIADRTPEPNADNVALPDPMSVLFNEALEPSSVSSTAVTLSVGGATLNTTSTLSSDGKTITVTLNDRSNLTFPATVTVALSPTIADLAGNAVGSVPTWAWTAPQWVKMPSQNGFDCDLVIDSTGRPLVSFLTDTTAGGETLTVARYAAGATWDLGLGSPAGETVNSGVLGLDATGAPVVAWSDPQVKVARWDGSAWSALGGVVDGGLTGQTGSPVVTSIAFDNAGTPIVGWYENYGTSIPDAIGYVATLGTAGTTGSTTWQMLPPSASAGPGGPELAVDDTGTLFGFFSGNYGSAIELDQYASGSWTKVDTSTVSGLLYGLALDPGQGPVILSQQTESNVQVIRLWSHSTTGWSLLVPPFSTPNAGTIGGVAVAFDPTNGNPILAWTQSPDATYILSVARFNGSTWDTSYGSLDGLPGEDASVDSFSLALDQLGAPTLAWSQEVTTGARMLFVWKSNS